MRRRAALAALLTVVLVACSSDGGDEASPSTTAGSARATSTTSTTSVPPEDSRFAADVEALADDAMEGRDNQTPGSERAQEYLIHQLEQFAEPLGDDFRQPFAVGSNVVAVIPGAELRDEYVVLGAHYDHLGRKCSTTTGADDICNGATDNAAGVAAVLEIGRRLAAGEPPRRSVVLGFWDAEEDALQGSAAYVGRPLAPLDATVAYLNWDIQGANLLPELARTTIVVGAETGGAPLSEAAGKAGSASELDTLALSLLFGQGRSDHAVFVGAGVPTAFFTDSTSACYHTSQDDISAVDFDKLGQQIALGEALARDLAATDTPPTFTRDAPIATYEDARSMLAVVARAQPGLQDFSPAGRATVATFEGRLEAMVDAGPEAFDDEAVSALLGGSVQVVRLLTEGDCDSHAG
ncbi:MAG: peptidase [Acidimicrobiales bacterium]|nr:peptidase [Acidimicrobiales bacterium]